MRRPHLSNVFIGARLGACTGAGEVLGPITAPSNWKDPVKIQNYVEEQTIKRIENAGENALAAAVEEIVVLDEDGKHLLHKIGAEMGEVVTFLRTLVGRYCKTMDCTLVGLDIRQVLREVFVTAVEQGVNLTHDDLYMLQVDPAKRRNEVGGIINPLSLVFPRSTAQFSDAGALMRLGIGVTSIESAEDRAKVALAVADVIGL